MLRFLQVGLLFSLAALSACSSNPSAPAPGKPGNGDTTHRTLRITPDSSAVTIRTKVIFTLSATPTPLPKPYTITWRIDSAQFVRTSIVGTNTDTLSCTFTSLGKFAVSAVYTDSTGTKRDSARTIITVNDTSSAPPSTSGLGGFKMVFNGDTLDRAPFENTCSSAARYLPSQFGAAAYELTISLSYDRTSLYGTDARNINLDGTITGPPGPGTYPIISWEKSGGIVASIDSVNSMFVSIDGGSLTITTFDTTNNLLSGTFHVLLAQHLPTPDPNKIDTIVASFSDVGIYYKMFNQGNMTATANGTPFEPIDNSGLNLQAYVQTGNPLLTINGVQGNDSNEVGLSIFISTPQVGTFSFGNYNTPGGAACTYAVSGKAWNTFSNPGSGTLTITKYDPVNRRISGTFTVSPTGVYNATGTIPITNGVLDNVTWIQE